MCACARVHVSDVLCGIDLCGLVVWMKAKRSVGMWCVQFARCSWVDRTAVLRGQRNMHFAFDTCAKSLHDHSTFDHFYLIDAALHLLYNGLRRMGTTNECVSRMLRARIHKIRNWFKHSIRLMHEPFSSSSFIRIGVALRSHRVSAIAVCTDRLLRCLTSTCRPFLFAITLLLHRDANAKTNKI